MDKWELEIKNKIEDIKHGLQLTDQFWFHAHPLFGYSNNELLNPLKMLTYEREHLDLKN